MNSEERGSKAMSYLMQRAEPWVSVFVLVGCCAITLVLVYAARQADVFGAKLVSGDTASLDQSI